MGMEFSGSYEQGKKRRNEIDWSMVDGVLEGCARAKEKADALHLILTTEHAPEEESTAVKFGQIFTKIIDQAADVPGVTRQALCNEMHYHPSSVKRIEKAEKLPEEEEYIKKLIPAIEKGSGRPVKVELQAEGRELLTEAHEIRRNAQEKYEFEMRRCDEAFARIEAGAARASELKVEIESLEGRINKLEASRSGASSAPGGQQVTADPNVYLQMFILRSQLADARADLARVLEQQEGDIGELRNCLQQLSDTFAEVDQSLGRVLKAMARTADE
ncbi:hypothetical protein ACIPC1_34630 [Streptomyces sp. NPDC087263]|uniref:hypothetical protein n=1 Tax=Streptomyces sp. NPDC087263 TaxID=3365773 RepID=UPI003812BC6E